MKFEDMINKIINCDCYEMIKNIPDNSIDCIYTDIPYDINYSGGGCLQKNVKNAVKDMNKNKDTLLKGIDYKILDEWCRIMKKININFIYRILIKKIKKCINIQQSNH